MQLTRYKHLNVGKPISLDELKPASRERKLTPRQIAQLERDREIKAVVNEAAAAAESTAIPILLRADQKLPTMRAAVLRVLKEEKSSVRMAVRGDTIYLSRGPIPGGRGRRPKSA